MLCRLALAGAALACLGLPLSADAVNSLWLGTLTRHSTGFQDVLQIDTSGNVLKQVADSALSPNNPSFPITGIATDGSSLYFGDSFGWIRRTTLDGSTVLGSDFWVYPHGTEEDLAWDPLQSSLWRVSHSNILQKIDPVTQNCTEFFVDPLAAQFSLTGHACTESSPIQGSPNGLGIAYGGGKLYVSFCNQGCSGTGGLVEALDPGTGAISTLFSTNFTPGGLAFDASSGSLWVTSVDDFKIRNMSLAGNVIGQPFAQPPQDGQVVGLEFVDPPAETPEPGFLVPLAGLLVALVSKVAGWPRQWLFAK